MSLLSDFRFATRSLIRRPGFSVVAVGTLAVGIGATAAIFSVANGVLLRSLPYPESHELVAVWQDSRTNPSPEPGGRVSGPNFDDMRVEVGSFESLAHYTDSNLTVSSLGAAEVVSGARVNGELFRVFGADPVMGRTFTEEENRYEGPAAVVVSDGFWRSRLGSDPQVLGTTLTISGTVHPVVGVAPPGFGFPDNAQLWVPIQNNEESCGRGCSQYAAVGRLMDGATEERAAAELETLATRLEAEHPQSNAETTFRTTPLRDLMVGDVRTALWVLVGAVAMVLLIACANVANLILVRGRSRRTELAVRAALGAQRGAILRQLMTENLVLALAGGVGGVTLAWWGVSALVSLAPPQLPRLDEVGLDGATLLFSLGVVALTVLVFGLAPALRLSSGGVANTMRQGSRGRVGDDRGHRARSVVLVAQVALSVVLLLGAGLMLRSLVRMQSVELGIEPADVTVFRLSLPESRYPDGDAIVAFIDRLETQLEGIPGVEAVATMVAVPFGYVGLYSGFTRPELPAPEPAAVPNAYYRALDPDAFEVLGIDVVAGRPFLESDRHGAESVAMVNRAAAEQYWPGEDPIGKRMDLQIALAYPDTAPRTIVGITENFRSRVTQEPGPEMYVPYAQSGGDFPHVALRTRNLASGAVLAAVREEMAVLDPELPLIEPASMEAMIARQTAASRFYLLLLGLFAIVAVSLAAVGIYGVVAYLVVQRTREIGMRIALGARMIEVVRLVVWQGLGPALVGVAIGLAAALAMGRLISGILYDVQPTDPATYAVTTLLLLTVVVAATAIPARRASRIPPAHALRNE